jgi:hypothetical protein
MTALAGGISELLIEISLEEVKEALWHSRFYLTRGTLYCERLKEGELLDTKSVGAG